MGTDREFSRSGRLLLACVAGIAFGSVGLAVYSIGAFVDPLGREFGWTRAQVQTAILFSSGLGGLCAPLIGLLVDRYGPRLVALVGLAGVGIGFLIASRSGPSIWQFYAGYAVVATLGAGSGPISWTRAIAGQFVRHRGLALAIALSGTGLVAIVAPPLAVLLIETFGWRAGYVGLALLPLLIALPLGLLFFRPTDEVVAPVSDTSDRERLTLPGLTTREAVSSYRFWVLLVSVLAMYLGIAGMIPNLIPALTDKGIAPQSAALALSSFGASVIVGRLAVGWLVDRYWAPGVATLVLTPAVIACLILMGEPSVITATGAAILAGLAAGAELDLLAFMAAKYFGLRSYARIYSFLYAGVAIAGGIGPLAFAQIYQVTGSYDVSFAVAAVLFAVGGPIALTLGQYPLFAESENAARHGDTGSLGSRPPATT